MKTTLCKTFILLVLLTVNQIVNVVAQEKYSKIEIDKFEQEVEQLISFLRYSINTIGDNETPQKERQTIINQSFLKVFRDAEVQIEDDLDLDRKVPINKNVQAYLKDIDFFFKHIKFDFIINEIGHYYTDNGQLYFKVNLYRHIKGTGIDGKSIEDKKQRYIELNLDSKTQDLKVVSIYTTKLNPDADLQHWWNQLSYEWQTIFKKAIVSTDDSLDITQLKKIVRLDKIYLSNNRFVTNLKPITKLVGLKELNISNTQINDISPLRNLSVLEVLNAENTVIENLKPLQYTDKIKSLLLSNTNVTDLSSIYEKTGLEILDISNTKITSLSSISKANNLIELKARGLEVSDIQPIVDNPKLEILDISNTGIIELAGVESLENLVSLDISNTSIDELLPLSKLKYLQFLFAENTLIDDLTPITSLPHLKRVFCDNAKLSEENVNTFSFNNPNVIITFQSENRQKWWADLSNLWKAIFRRNYNFTGQPTKERLAEIFATQTLDISGKNVMSLDPLMQLRNLRTLLCSNTGITSLAVIEKFSLLEHLDLSNNAINSLAQLSSLNALTTLDISNTEVDSLNELNRLEHLIQLNCEGTPITREQIAVFSDRNIECLVLFQSEKLYDWWLNISEEWKTIFRDKLSLTNDPDDIQIHLITKIDEIIIKNNPRITSLDPLEEIAGLEKLVIENTNVSSIFPIRNLKRIKVLRINKSPLDDLTPIQNFKGLLKLDVSNTPITDLSAVVSLIELRDLKISGTQVKSIKPVSNLVNLKSLEFDNTKVSSLSPIIDLYGLEKLVCYNTKISKKKIDKFKERVPSCEVTFY